MARPRRSAGRDYAAEYARRQARAKAAGFGSYYEQRIARATAKRPGISRSQARGHRSVADVLRAIQSAPGGTQVSFMGLDRQADGTWRRASILLLAGDGSSETEFVLGPRQLRRLPEIEQAIGSAGFAVLGAEYMQEMVEWVDEHYPEWSSS